MEEPGLPALQDVSVSEQDAIDCVPDSLYMFLRLLFGGQLLHIKTVEEHLWCHIIVYSAT